MILLTKLDYEEKSNMGNFLELEGGYLVIASFALLITLFVTTRPFFTKIAIRNGMLGMGLFWAIAIGFHFKVTTDRMEGVKSAFAKGETVICESRMQRKVAQFVEIDKSREWFLEEDLFTSPNYSRPFHTARCLVK